MVEVSAPGARAGTSGTFGNELPLVAALHLRLEPGNVPGNLRLAERTLTAAKRAHPALRWAVLPERLTTEYAGLRAAHRYAEDAEGGPNATFFASLARRLGP